MYPLRPVPGQIPGRVLLLLVPVVPAAALPVPALTLRVSEQVGEQFVLPALTLQVSAAQGLAVESGRCLPGSHDSAQ